MPTISPILELQRQQLLLQMEYEEEKKAFAQKVDAIGMERRIQRGDAWWPIRIGRTYYNSLNQLCVEVFRTQNDEEIDHNFEFGRPIEFFFSEKHKVKSVEFATAPQESPAQHSSAVANSTLCTLHSSLKGTVSFVDGNRMVIHVPDGFPVGSLPQ